MSELRRMIELHSVDNRVRHLEAGETERAALAERFGLVSVLRLEADIELVREGDVVDANGSMEAEIVQVCAVTGDDFPVSIREQLKLRFVPHKVEARPDEEIELDANELDEIPYEGTGFDMGEAVAESLGLAIDPYACGPGADAARKEAGLLDEEAAGPFAALAALKGKPE